MLHSRFIFRELLQGKNQALIFVCCVALALTTLVALNSFQESVHRSILADARTLHGGDIIIHSHSEFTAGLTKAVADLERQRLAVSATTFEFYSVVRPLSADASLLANIKIAGPAYPLYGRLELKSGRDLDRVLGPGSVVVEQEILDRLHLQEGDQLHVGSGVLRIADVVRHEPDRPVNLFALGPRVFVALADRDQVDLIKKGSRIDYLLRLKVFDQKQIDHLADQLKGQAETSQERVDTFRTASSGVKKFFDNLLFFLSLISIFTLLLAGIGMQSSLAALLREREQTIAIAKALGASNSFLLRHYLVLVVILGLAGSGVGILAGITLEHLSPWLFAGFIPNNRPYAASAAEVATWLVLGLVGVLLFTYLPLYRMRQVKPWAIFRRETAAPPRGLSFYLVLALGLLFLAGVIVDQLEDVRIGLSFMLGAVLLIAIIAGMTHLALKGCARARVSSLSGRQALKSLFRPGNASRAIITTLAAALAVLLSIYLVEDNLHATFVASYPADAPNLFCLDIQTEQKEQFSRTIPVSAQFYPIIRARLNSINGEAINRQKELSRRRDNLAREFNLTYREGLLEDEVLLAGKALFRQEWQEKETVQVSILDTVAEMGDMHLDDLLQFNIQGVPLTARVTSIRTRTRSRLYPFFYFVFPEQVLKAAPQTFFAALLVDKAAIPQLENKIVAAFPNVSAINMAETAAALGTLLAKLTNIVNVFALFSILAGGLIVVSSVFATRLARTREAVYYKVLGGNTWFVTRVFVYENILLALFSSMFAVILAQAGSWALCRFFLDIPYRPGLIASLLLVVLTTLVVVGVGLLSSISIISQKPALFLREQADS